MYNTNVNAIDLSNWTTTINKIARDLHRGKLKPKDLNAFLVLETFKELEKAAKSGYGKDWVKFDPVNSKTVQKLRSNLYLFSGVKTYQQLTEMNSLLVDNTGKIRSFNEFKKEVFKVHKKYNRNYLQAEYQTAKASAQKARQWQDFKKQKHLYPNLIYKTVGDGRVREEHVKLNGIIKPIDDAFWDVYYPPNGWRCRCGVTSTKAKATLDKNTPKIEIDNRFKQNVGKSKQVFNREHHPYFSTAVGDKKYVEKVLEKWKLAYPQYKVRYKAKNGAKVLVSAFADASDLFGNYRAAIKMADEGIDVKIRPHVIIEEQSNAEYLINDLIADRAEPKGSRGVLTALDKKVNEQGCELVVLDLTYKYKGSRFELAKALKGATNVNKKLKEVILVFDKEIIHLKREEMFTQEFWSKVIKKSN